MKNLMKYEMRKTWVTKLILLGVTAAVEIAFLIGLYADLENVFAVSIALLVMLSFGALMILGLQSVITLHQDMNTRQSYMLFMTPNNSYRILGAKVLENGLSILLGGVFYFALGALDLSLLAAKHGELKQLWDTIRQFISAFNSEIQLNLGSLASLAFLMVAGWISVVTTAFLADVISAALLNGKKHNGFVSFLIFLLLSWLTSLIGDQLTKGVTVIDTQLILQGVISLVFACVMYVITAQIMDKRLSV